MSETTTLTRGARGGGAMISGQILKLLLQLVGLMILSRLLSPEDFGLVAMVTVFLALGDLIRDFGMPLAALQARDLSPQQASNVFWVSSSLGLVAAGLLAVGAPAIAWLYGEPALNAIAPVMAVGLLLGGVQAQYQVALARSMRFKALVGTDLLAQFVSLGAAIAAAAAGWGYWALVVQGITTPTVMLIGRLVMTRWVPSLPRRGHGSAQLLRSGTEFGLAQLLSFAASNVDTFVIGARWGADALGYYTRAFRIYMLPRNGLLDPLTPVVVPTVNQATRGGTTSASRVLIRVQFLLSLALTWTYLLMAVTADWLVPLVLGPQWAPSVMMLQLLSIGGAFAAFGTVSYWTFIVENQSRQLLYLHLVTKPLSVVLIVAAMPFGPNAVALAFSLGLAIAWPINLLWLAKVVKQDSLAFFWMGLRVLVAAAVAFAVSRFVLGLFDLPPLVMVAIGILVASIAYAALILVFPGGAGLLRESIAIARSALRSGAR